MLTCLAMMENNLIDFLQARSLNNKTSVACEILAHAQECTSDCARMHRLELDEPNVRPWLKLCSVTRAACLAIAQERGTECEKRGLVPGGSCSQIRGDSRLIWESAAGAEEARIARDLGIGAGEGRVEDHRTPPQSERSQPSSLPPPPAPPTPQAVSLVWQQVPAAPAAVQGTPAPPSLPPSAPVQSWNQKDPVEDWMVQPIPAKAALE